MSTSSLGLAPRRARSRQAPLRSPSGAVAEDLRSAFALAEEVRSAFEYMPATLVGMVAGTAVVTLLFWSLTPPAS